MKSHFKSAQAWKFGVLGTLAAVVSGYSQSADALIDKLVDKGILSVKEANELREESDNDFKKAYSVRSGMPDWITSVRLNGDLRLRYDGIFQDNAMNPADPNPALNTPGAPDRNRLRYRLRFGPTVEMTDNFELGIRLASGELGSAAAGIQPSASVFSANATLNGDASRKPIFLDAGYVKWSPGSYMQLQAGKMDNLFWITDAVIDYDYQPEGAQEQFVLPISENQKISFTAGQWVIVENYRYTTTVPTVYYPNVPSYVNNDAYEFINQIDYTARWTPHFSSRLAVAMMNLHNQKGITHDAEAFINQNGLGADGTDVNNPLQTRPVNFNPLISRAQLTYLLDSAPHFTGPFPISISGEYGINPGAPGGPAYNATLQQGGTKTYNGAANQLYNLGLTLGNVEQRGNWQITYNYKTIETASTWHGTVDDDFGYNGLGGTNVRGHHIKAWYRPFDPMQIVFSYFITEAINTTGNIHPRQQRLFMDLVWAF